MSEKKEKIKHKKNSNDEHDRPVKCYSRAGVDINDSPHIAVGFSKKTLKKIKKGGEEGKD